MNNFFKRSWDRLVSMLTGRTKRFYGRKLRDPKDARDHIYVPKDEVLKSLTKGVDLRSQDGPIFDQGQLGSCTANGWLGLFMFVAIKLFKNTFLGSRLQLYYDERVLNGTPTEDSGAYVRDGAKCLADTGVCSEQTCPYDISNFADKPSDAAYAEAANNKIVEYMRIQQDITHLKACLTEGFPFVFGFDVYESFESATVARTGIMPMPKSGEKVLGGHCVEGIGYIDAQGETHFFRTIDRIKYAIGQCLSKICHGVRIASGIRVLPVTPPTNVIICRNSWGTGWGDSGYFYMPYAYISDSKYCDDFWTIRQLTLKQAA